MGFALEKHQSEVTSQISNCLKDYFDPNSGRFNERVKRLIDGDGELVQVIRGQFSGDGSELTRTLTAHVGKESPLMHMLDPKSSDGLISQINKSTEETLSSQKEHILSEFSLDNGEGALSRLASELTKKHGEVGKALEDSIGEVISEFSLDKDDSALSRLVGQVMNAQRQISSEFSLDEEGSALARMRKELLNVLVEQQVTNNRFQEEVKVALAEMKTQKEESQRSTRHGLDFEDEVFKFVSELNLNTDDLVIRAGNTAGNIPRSKKGDVVVELGQEHVAAGTRIVIEAKANASYTIDGALAELEEAKKNRNACTGLFVFSYRTAPAGLEAFSRYGDNIVVVWDAEDSSSNVVLKAGHSVAKALCVQNKSHSDDVGADIDAIESSARNIENQVKSLDEIRTWANTIKNNSDKILKNADRTLNVLEEAIEVLNEKVGGLRRM